MRKRVLFISNLYPNPFFPAMASFNRQQIDALQEYCDVEVISPISWTEHLKHKFKQPSLEQKEIEVHYPIYYYPPRIFRELYGEFFYYSIKDVALSLLEKKKFDLIFSSWLYPDSWAAAKLAKRYNLPFFVKVHGSDVNKLTPGTIIARRSLEVAQQAEKIICVSRALKERMIKLGAAEQKLVVLYNGVNQKIFCHLDRDDVRHQLSIDPADFLVLYVGNLKKEKGLRELLTAFKVASDNIADKSLLVVIGSGPYEATAKQLATSLGLSDKVRFIGSLNLKSIALWMNAASLLCLPSYMEGVPNVVIEALSCGTRVVATNVGGIPELDKGDGMITLVPPKTVAPLADALTSLAKNDCTSGADASIASWQENAQQLHAIMSDVP